MVSTSLLPSKSHADASHGQNLICVQNCAGKDAWECGSQLPTSAFQGRAWAGVGLVPRPDRQDPAEAPTGAILDAQNLRK